MAILHSCCLWKSVRKGSFACGIYTLFYFGCSSIIVLRYLHEEQEYLTGAAEKPSGQSFLENGDVSPTSVIFNILLLACSSCGVVSSILVIIGLKTDERRLLIPWILFMAFDILLEVSHFLYLLVLDTLRFNPMVGFVYTLDFFIICLNLYSLLCVISQYQEYKEGRGFAQHRYHPDRVYYIPPTGAATSVHCLHPFRPNQATAVSPLLYPNTNVSTIHEESEDKSKLEAEQNSETQSDSFQKRKVQFCEEENGDTKSTTSAKDEQLLMEFMKNGS